ncbi:lysis protein, partial [Pseudomonas aeruginosa]
MGILSLLRSNWFWVALVAVLYSVAVVIHGSASYDRGYATARAEGDAALLNLQLQHSNELAKIAGDNLLQFQQQVTRANQAEARFLSVQDQFTALQQQLSERIAHV